MRGRIRGTTTAMVAVATMLLSGCAGAATHAAPPPPSTMIAAAAPTSTPTPTAPPYDLTIERPFTLSDGRSATGCVQLAVDLLTGADGTADPRVVRARALLKDHDWMTEPVSLDELSADERSTRKDHGQSEQEMLAGVLLDHMTKAVTDAGLLGENMSLRGHVGC